MKFQLWVIAITSLVMVFAGLQSNVFAEDVIILKSGRTITGKIVNRTDEFLEVEMSVGKSRATVTVPIADVERIEKGTNRNDEFRKRWSELKPRDLTALGKLLEWCESEGLKIQASQVRKRIEKEKLELLKEEFPELWCRPCGATGKLSCAGCKGKGHTLNPCPRCAGEGEVGCRSCSRKKEGSLDCRRCGGAGVYERFDPAKGKKVKTRCNTCSGKGKIECPTCKGKQRARCSDCTGEGSKGVP